LSHVTQVATKFPTFITEQHVSFYLINPSLFVKPKIEDLSHLQARRIFAESVLVSYHCPTGRYRAQLLSSALRYCDDVTGCLIDEGDAEGNVRKSTRRLWPQTEIAKAWIAQAEAGEQGAADKAFEALARLHRHYLSHPVVGGWYDQFDRDNRSLVDTIPASSFYHVVRAIAEAERVLAPLAG